MTNSDKRKYQSHKQLKHNDHANTLNYSILLNDRDRLVHLIESTFDWLWELDTLGHCTYSSPQVYEILGYSREEVIGLSPMDLMSEEEAIKTRIKLAEVLASKKPYSFLELKYLHKTGYEVTVESSGKPWFDQRNIFRGYRGIDRNISERKALQIQAHNYGEILKQMAEPALVVDSNRKINYLNPAFYSLFGYAPGSLIGEHISILQITDSDNLLQPDKVIEEVKTHGIWRGESKRKKANGAAIDVMISVKAAYDSNNEITAYIATYFDLTIIKQAEAELRQSMIGTIQAISCTLEKRDPYTAGHQKSVADLCVAIAGKMHKSESFIEGLKFGALIHDIGKIQIPAEVLNRPGRLKDYEMSMVKDHVMIGYEIVKDVDFPWPVKEIILQHHERLDGSGYPMRLHDKEILLEAKILAVADVVEAMSSHRPYRPAVGMEKALMEIKQNRGRLYDPQVVDICVQLFEEEHFKLEQVLKVH